jgi:hypothetical protein
MSLTTKLRKFALVSAAALVTASAGLSSAAAASNEDLQMITARLDALERENAVMRRENDALRENRRLREQNANLKPVAQKPRVTASMQSPAIAEAMMADMPVKAPYIETSRRLQFWVEGGAVWSGGDRITDAGVLSPFGALGGNLPFGTSTPFNNNLTPKVGWEVAAGFDYRLASSPWHVSGQFRYSEGGRTSSSATAGGAIDPAILALFGGGVTSASATADRDRNYNERRGIADLALGRDLWGSGSDALQIKGGLRVAEFATRTGGRDGAAFAIGLDPASDLGGLLPAPVSQISIASNTAISGYTNFLGAGPLIGIEGSVPFMDRWSFDYKGNAAILFGSSQSTFTSLTTVAADPAILGLLLGAGNSFTNTATSFNYMLSADMQVGFSYWVTPNVKVGASYRLDAMVNIGEDNNIMPNRYIHGPRFSMMTQF